MKPAPALHRLALAGLLSLPTAGALAQNVWIDFDHRADGTLITLPSGSDLWTADTRAVLAGFGITVGALSHPDLYLRIGNHANLQLPTPGNSLFGWAGVGTPHGTGVISYRLEFAAPVDQLQFARAGLIGGTSSKAWQALAFAADGHELGHVGETDASSGYDGKDWSAKTYALSYQDIAWLELRSNFGGGPATYLSPPLDDLSYQTGAVPEASGWALMALGPLRLALRRHHVVQPGETA